MNTKSLLLSKTLWGAVLVLVSTVTGMAFDPSVVADEIVTGIGTLLAIYGRFTATTKLTVK